MSVQRGEAQQELSGPFSGSHESADGSVVPEVSVLGRGQGDAQGGKSGNPAAPDSSGLEASRGSTPPSDRSTADETASAADGPGPVPPDLPNGPTDALDHPDEPITKPESGTADNDAERQVLVGALARLERKDQEIDQLKMERDQAKAENDKVKAENDRLKAELGSFKAKETQPGDSHQPHDTQPAEQPESAQADEAASGLEHRNQPDHSQGAEQGESLRKRFGLPSDKALGAILAVSSAADYFAVAAHAIPGSVASGIGVVATAGAAAIVWGRERWGNRRKNGH